MSKELEALKDLIKRNNALKNEGHFHIGKDTLDTISQALTPPTQEEVCKALSDYLGEKMIYLGFDFVNVDITKIAVQFNLKNKNIELYVELPPHLITMIGRFYENEVQE